MDRLIFHVDVNSAYLSWEAVRHLEKTGLDLRTIPAAIGGNEEKRTGIILAKSIPAKAMGIKTGEPVSMAKRKCPSLLLLPPDFRLYQRNSAAFMEICRSFAPVVEQFSIDECFLDMTGTSLLYPDPVAIAHTIKDKIFGELGFTVNIGIGDNKLLAKMASDFEKPNKVHTLFRREIPEKLWPLPISELFMLGKSTAARLAPYSIRTVGDLAGQDLSFLQTLLGEKHGALLYARARGVDDSPVLATPEAPKGYSISTTLEEDVTDRKEAARILLALSDSVSARMRADKVKCTCISVTIRANDFRDHAHQETLSAPTDGTMTVYTHACKLFDALWDGRTPLRLLGVSLTRLTDEENEQISFFQDPKEKKETEIDKAVDKIRSRYGTDTVMRGAVYSAPIKVGKKYRAQMEEKAKGK